MANVANFVRKQLEESLHAPLYEFCKTVGIFPDTREQPHREMYAFIDRFRHNPSAKTQRKGLLLAPRYSYKSSGVVAACVQHLCLYPNIKIAVFRATRELAVGMLREIKSIITTNPVILSAYGDMSKGSEKWTDTEIVINRRESPDRDPSVFAAGMEVSTTGMHSDLIVGDDLVVYENCDSPGEMNRAMGLIYSMTPILPPHGALLLSGTTWSGIDCWARIVEENRRAKERGETPPFEEYIRSVYLQTDDGTALYFPHKLSEEFLEQQRKTLPPRWFSSWYLMSTYEEGLKPFAKISLFDGEYENGAVNTLSIPELGRAFPIETVMTLDTALTANRRSDRFGAVVTAKDAADTWYVLEAREFLKLPSDVTLDIIDLLMTYEPSILLIESANADVAMVSRLEDAIREYGLRTRIESYSALQDEERGRRGKARRIESLEPRNRAGKLFLKRGMCADLLRQMDLYPAIEHDDVIDSLAMTHKAMDLVPDPAGTFEEAAEHEYFEGLERPDPWRKRIESRQETLNQDSPVVEMKRRTGWWTGPHGPLGTIPKQPRERTMRT